MTADLELLQRAARYALVAIDVVTPEVLTRPTPCRQWNLHMLLSHTCESVAAFQEGLDDGRVALFPADRDATARNPTDVLRGSLNRLVDVWTATGGERNVAVADHRIPLSMIGAAAALEIAVHGWDIAQASGDRRPIPEDLAVDLLRVSTQLVTDDTRHHLFAPPVRACSFGPGERLIAFLGRRPDLPRRRPDGRT